MAKLISVPTLHYTIDELLVMPEHSQAHREFLKDLLCEEILGNWYRHLAIRLTLQRWGFVLAQLGWSNVSLDHIEQRHPKPDNQLARRRHASRASMHFGKLLAIGRL